MPRIFKYIKSIIVSFSPYGLICIWRRMQQASLLGMPKAVVYKRAFNNSMWTEFNSLGFSLLTGTSIRQGGNIIDVGSNQGKWALRALQFLAPKKLLCFEPDPKTYNRMQRRLSEFEEVICHNFALSNKCGEQIFYVTENDHCSSLYKPLPDVQRFYDRKMVEKKTIKVITERLDDIHTPDRIDLIKVDVQGSELAVIEGARETLKKTSLIMIEANFKPHYQGGSTFAEVHEKLMSLGFVLHNFGDGFQQDGEMLWMDAVYKNCDC